MTPAMGEKQHVQHGHRNYDTRGKAEWTLLPLKTPNWHKNCASKSQP